MTLPSKPQQIAAVARFLDSDFTEGKSLEEVAKAIVNGYHEALTAGLKKPATPLRLGMLFKMPIDGKVRRVAWMDEGKVWIVSDTDSYGCIGPEDSTTWESCEEFHPKRRIDGKVIEMSDEEIEESWSNPDWIVGDVVSTGQRQNIYEIIATGPQCVLMRDVKTDTLLSDSSAALKKYYRRERKVGEISW